ncbi:MAG: spermidine synthase [Acidobacteria bacterium]|nr:spermidine synthase [Acidobacteriota bacterium]
MTHPHQATRVFLSSFLVLFLEVALIRWMPAYIRLLAYFSNFILLATFLGIGIGCLVAPARARLFAWFPLLVTAVVALVRVFRLEVGIQAAGSIYFTSGTAEKVTLVESTTLLPVIFVVVAALFATLAQRMGREMAELPPLRAYTINLAGSLAGVAAFGVMSWQELPPAAWFGVGFAAALPLLASAEPGAAGRPRRWLLGVNVLLLGVSLAIVARMAAGAIWSPYYKITVGQDGPDTVIEVNNIFHQSMAPVEQKEYFYQWPYMAFGDTFENVLVLGAGSGTDVAAALRHGAKHVDAVEIDPVILRLGAQHHPDRPYSDPRVTRINDDARHFLRTTTKRYDLVVFALIDSLTLQSSFSGVRLESYMFTTESFRSVRDRLAPNGLLVVYNYFRERWLVDRLANQAAIAFGEEPRVHVHEARSYLGVMMAGPRLKTLTADPVVPDRVTAFGQSHDPSPARVHRRDPSIEPATDDWPFLYLRDRHMPAHYVWALALILIVSVAAVMLAMRGQRGTWSWTSFLLGAAFMLLETKSIIQFALLWGSTWFVASLVIASVLTMALVANFIVAKVEIRRPWLVCGVLVALLGANYLLPVGRIGVESRAIESLVYAALVFSPIVCAGLLFGTVLKHSTSVARDYGTNLLGAMVGGVGEYLSLLTGFNGLLLIIAICYVAAVAAWRRAS